MTLELWLGLRVAMPSRMLKVPVGGGTSDENEMCNERGVADVFSGFAIPSELHCYGFLALTAESLLKQLCTHAEVNRG